MVEGQSRIDLYSEFAKNRQRSSFRRMAPFVATMSIETPLGIASLVHDAALATYLSREYPLETNAVSIALAVSLGITGIGALTEYLDITRVNSPNGKLAMEIAHTEGRDPQTKEEIKSEIERVKRTVDAAKRIAPSPSALFDLDVNHRWTRFRSSRKPEVTEERAISDRNFRKWAVKATERTDYGYPQDPQVIIDSLLLADRQWGEIIEDPNQPEYKKRYGLLMRDEIKKKMQEQLGTGRNGATATKHRYESMGPQELGKELNALISEFPENTSERIGAETDLLNQDLERGNVSAEEWYKRWEKLQAKWDETVSGGWKTRDELPEKKVLFEKLRALILYSPTTRGFQEVLLRELEFQYNSGLEIDPDGKQTLSEPLMKLVSTVDPFGNNNLFDAEQSDENERKLYAIVSPKHKIKWSPIRYYEEEVPNRVVRWLKNRREDAVESLFFGFGKLLPQLEPKLERSWKWQYRAKYKKSLKPFNK